MIYSELIAMRVLVVIKGVFVANHKSRSSGFKNAIISGILIEETDNALYIGEDNITTIIPKDSVGGIWTDSTSFFDGIEELELPPESEIN